MDTGLWSERVNADCHAELWKACAGPLVHLPEVGLRAFYFPQGHLEQEAVADQKLNDVLPLFNLPSKILCRVVNIDLRATETDEVYAQVILFPEIIQDDVDTPDPLLPEPSKPPVKSFCKILTATDTRRKLHVHQQDAYKCFPPLDMAQETLSQELVAKDLNGSSWRFKHVFSGNPKRHLLSTGWKHFVKSKRLVSGDSVIFSRGENGELRVGVRHVSCQWRDKQHGYSASPTGIPATANHALISRSRFTVFYRPSSGSSPFIVGLNKYLECLKNKWSVGMRFSMRSEGKDHSERRFNGSIIEVGDVSTIWRDSQWQCLKVEWDDEPTMTIKPERVSPWEIDSVLLPLDENNRLRNKGQRHAQSKGHLSKRIQAEKTILPSHQSSAREDMEQAVGEGNMIDMPTCPNEQNWPYGITNLDMLNFFQHAAQSSQQQQQIHNLGQMGWPADWVQTIMPAMGLSTLPWQYWIQNVAQPNWPSPQAMSQVCQHSWVVNAAQCSCYHQAQNMSSAEQHGQGEMCLSLQQSNMMSMGPLFSNQDNWFQSMLHGMEQLDQQGSVKEAGESSCGHHGPVHLGELGQILGSVANDLDMTHSGQFPTLSPPIHFSELHGDGIAPPSRASESEESIEGETRKRKKSGVEDAESGNGQEVGCDSRRVKCRIEPSQNGMVSNSNQTYYSSASEGEPSIGKCNQEPPPVEGTTNATDRPVIYRAMDLIISLYYQLKNYVPFR